MTLTQNEITNNEKKVNKNEEIKTESRLYLPLRHSCILFFLIHIRFIIFITYKKSHYP